MTVQKSNTKGYATSSGSMTTPYPKTLLVWHTMIPPALVFVATVFCVFFITQLRHADIAITARSECAECYLRNFGALERNDTDVYRWSREDAALILDGFWGRPALLRVRLTSPRPPDAPPAEMVFYSGSHTSGPFLVEGDTWRTYHVLLPPIDKDTEKVQLIAVPFKESAISEGGVRRTLGVALSDLHATFPTAVPWRWPDFWWLMGVVLLPLLTYALVFTTAHFLWSKVSDSGHNRPGITALALVAAIATLYLAGTLAMDYPAGATVTLETLYAVVKILLLASVIPLLILPWIRSARIQLATWSRADYAIVAGLAGVALLIRIIFLPGMVWQLWADDFTSGVFALEILKGSFPIHYDETGTLSSYLLAPVFALAGPSLTTLLVLPLFLSTLLIVALYGIGNDLFGRWGALAAASWLMLPPANAMLWTIKPQASYLDSLTLSTLALWGTIRLFYGSPSRNQQIVLMGSIALALSLALWVNMVIAALVLTCVFVALINWKRLLHLSPVGYVLALIISVTILITLFLPAHTHAEHDKVNVILKLSSDTRIETMLDVLLPVLLGLSRPFGRESASLSVSAVLVVTTFLAAIATLYHAFVKRTHAGLIVSFLAVTTVVASLFSPFFGIVRYVFPLYVAIPLAFAALASIIVRQRYSQFWGPVLLVILLAANTSSALGDINLQTTYIRPEAELVRVLRQHDIRYVYTSYLIRRGITLESGGEIAVSSRVGPVRVSLIPREDALVEAAKGQDTAFIFSKNGYATPDFEHYLEQNEIACERIVVLDYYIIYNHCTPFPDIAALVDTMPQSLQSEQTRFTEADRKTYVMSDDDPWIHDIRQSASHEEP
jgi:hypothetical protein